MEESTSSGSSVYPMARDASTKAFQSTLSNIFFRNSLFISTVFSTTFSASMRNGNPFTTPFMLDDSMLCVSSLIFTYKSEYQQQHLKLSPEGYATAKDVDSKVGGSVASSKMHYGSVRRRGGMGIWVTR
ncbi:hypothetical protein V8G54_029061 [Vigna mungo]|uniref:Uncharacterized protein n=1 Tax=Vigna mungo TaxID=3915 RepID=A0AAQ3RM95_VIGMU